MSDFAPPVSKLFADIPNTVQPAAGQGLTLGPGGRLPTTLSACSFISELDLSSVNVFGSIPQFYRHLKIYAVLRSSRAATVTDSAFIQFNADGGSNYDYAFIQGNSGSVTAANGAAQTSMEFAAVPGASATASCFSIVEITIPYYTLTTCLKSFVSSCFTDTQETTGTLFNEIMGGTWRSTAAVTKVTLSPNTGTAWASGSKASLYGIS